MATTEDRGECWSLRRAPAVGDAAGGGDRRLRWPAEEKGSPPGRGGGSPPGSGGGSPPENGGAASPPAAGAAGAGRQKAGEGVPLNGWRLKFAMYAFQAAQAAGVRSPLDQALTSRAPVELKPGQGVPKRLK